MFGTLNTQPIVQSAINPPNTTLTPIGSAAAPSKLGSTTLQHIDQIPWIVVGLVVLYLAWAIVQQHEKVQSQIEPKNLAVNLHNLVAIALPVIVFLLLLKVAAAKWAAAKLPGSEALSAIVGAL
ncbi:MAG: hypothetical protein JRN15_10945 [Nitrososphaerota archaeon]|nr:hypothetical protein [Nitrososphaerota archaeon]